MKTFSNPVLCSSTTVGRTLLGWYCTVEAHCCFLSANEFLLPPEWRQQNVLKRQELAHSEYPHLSPEERKPRLLDDLWPQLWSLVPSLNHVAAKIPKLNAMKESRRATAAMQLLTKLNKFTVAFEGFINSPHVLHVLQRSSLTKPKSDHSKCCPKFPYTPYVFEYPPAGVFHLITQSIQAHSAVLLSPTLYAKVGQDQSCQYEASTTDIATSWCIEMCSTFAGIEHAYDGKGGVMFVSSVSMGLIAAFTCPPNLQTWMCCKLAHFEKLGQFVHAPLRRTLARVWNMPEIIDLNFSWVNKMDSPTDEESEITADMAMFGQEATEDVESDEKLRSITEMRGLFPNSPGD
jgi:hypothetical protein